MFRPAFAWMLCTSILFTCPASAEEKIQTPAVKSVARELTLHDVIAKALASSPRLRSFQAARQAAYGDHRQAGSWQNPQIGLGAENVGGTSEYRGFDSAQTTISATQLIEIGGKRSARVAAAKHALTLADFDYQAARLDMVRDVTQEFARAIAASEEVRIAGEQQKLAEDVLENVTKRVNAAREPLIQKSKANVAMAASHIALEKAKRDYEAARNVLANLMGGSEIFTLDATAFYTVTAPTAATEAKALLVRNPDIARWTPAIAKSQAELELERANAVPDPTLNAGWRNIRGASGLGPGTDEKAFLAGISIPIPVLNRNRGNIEKAHAEVEKAESDKQASELELGSELIKALEAEQAAYSQATILRETILPEAEHAFSLSRRGYQAGKLAYLEVLDAQRALADVRVQYVEALKDYHIQRAGVERLTAAYLSTDIAEDNHDKK